MMCRSCPRTPVGDVSGLNNKPGDDAFHHSRDGICIRVFVHAVRKFCLERTGGISFLPPLENKGGGAPNGAPPVPASQRDAGAVIRDRSPFGAPPRLCAGLIHPNSAWAALPGIAGCKREDPLRRQCSRYTAVPSRAGRDDAQTACRRKCLALIRKNRSRSINRCHRPMSLTTS